MKNEGKTLIGKNIGVNGIKDLRFREGFLMRMLAFIIISVLISFSANGSEVTDLIKEIKSKYVLSSSVIPVISNVTYQKEPVAAFDKFEISFKLAATYNNPFDPEEINVEGHFIYPDGKEVIVPGFFYDLYEPVKNKTTNTYLLKNYNSLNESGWKIRFSSGATGDYKFYITAKDSKGKVGKYDQKTFKIVRSNSKGYVTVSKTNPRYFENSADQSLFYGCGSNIYAVIGSEKDTSKQSYEYYFDKANGNCSSTRIWICHWRWLEWTPNPQQAGSNSYGGINFYNQALSSNLDRIFSMAEKINLRIQLTLEDNQEHEKNDQYDGWGFNPYNLKNGGPVATPEEYWTDKTVRKMYKKKLRYIAARWGYSTSMWSLNQWNDMSNPNANHIDYAKDLHDYAHSVFDGWRPIVFGSNFGQENDKNMDYAIFGKSKETNKPGVTQECYYTNNLVYFNSVLQEQLWEGLFLGNAVRMVWPHWDVNNTNSWGLFKSILNFVADVPLNKKVWSPLKVNTLSAGPVKDQTFQKVIEVKGYGDIASFGVKARQNLFHINTIESSQFLEGFASSSGWQGHNLYGKNKAALRNPPSFVINVPESGSMLVRVKLVAPGSHKLVSTVNGKPGPRLEWNDFKERIDVSERSKEEQYLSIPLSKGENKVTLDCEGPEYIRLGWIYFILETTEPSGLLAVNSLISDKKDDAIVYVKNQTYSELYHTILGKEPVIMNNVQLEVPGLKDGKYNLAFFDPTKGDYINNTSAVTKNGKIVLSISSIGKDMAIKIREASYPVEVKVPARAGNNPNLNGSLFTLDKVNTYSAENRKKADLPKPAGWYKAQQHTHSIFSDGRQTITQNVEFAIDYGFNILVSTDHSGSITEEEQQPMKEEILGHNKKGFLAIYGDEVSYNAKTNPPNEGHLLMYDIDKFIFQTNKQPQEVFDECRAQGGLAFIAHPFNTPYNYRDWSSTGYNGIEIWNGADHNVFCNTEGDWTPTRNSIAKWDELNKQGRRLVGIANSDSHNDNQIDDLWTVIYLPKFTKADYMKSLEKGHAYGTNGPSINFTVDDLMMGSDLPVPAKGKKVRIRISGNSNSVHQITKVTLIKNGNLEQQWLNPGTADFNAYVTKDATPGDFFRATVECMVTPQTNTNIKNGLEYAAFSNPVWITGYSVLK